jgi:hypothetical protein
VLTASAGRLSKHDTATVFSDEHIDMDVVAEVLGDGTTTVLGDATATVLGDVTTNGLGDGATTVLGDTTATVLSDGMTTVLGDGTMAEGVEIGDIAGAAQHHEHDGSYRPHAAQDASSERSESIATETHAGCNGRTAQRHATAWRVPSRRSVGESGSCDEQRRHSARSGARRRGSSDHARHATIDGVMC